jgi:hypothetical protein
MDAADFRALPVEDDCALRHFVDASQVVLGRAEAIEDSRCKEEQKTCDGGESDQAEKKPLYSIRAAREPEQEMKRPEQQ